MSDWWDDFSNNLATDLGPLIALFGETPTKQYLSECLNLVDVIIFASCPLGILTAVVSAIRVCGTPSLRAFIGRAQEGRGSAEAELCSSTSRDVCELYNNGGIARVFGRPKLLEFVHVTEPPLEEFYATRDKTPSAGIHASKEYFQNLDESDEWVEDGIMNNPAGQTSKKGINDLENPTPKTGNNDQYKEENFAPNPNLSLNVGIKPRDKFWFISAAVLGVVLQSAVLLWAVITRYTLHLFRDGSESHYAVPFTITGTILLCIGMAFCASLIEKSTKERVFTRKRAKLQDRKTSIYWVQPGNQHVGDQVFDSFAYTHKYSLNRYTTSWKRPDTDLDTDHDTDNDTNHERWAWISVSTTVSTTMVGFVLQFLGLRACHSSVAVVQLAATLVMSLVRAGLRTERLEKQANLLTEPGQPDLYLGHELDWLALKLGRNISEHSDKSKDLLWHVLTFASLPSQYNQIIVSDSPDRIAKPPLQAAERHFKFRVRLGELTGLGLDPIQAQGSSSWEDHQIAVRHLAKIVAHAMEKTLQILLDEKSGMPFKLSPQWRKAFGERGKSLEFFWPLPCNIGPTKEDHVVYLSLKRNSEEYLWRANVSEIEAALGLWLWSLKRRTRRKTKGNKDHPTTGQEQGLRWLRSLNKENADEFQLWRSRGNNATLTITSSTGGSTRRKPEQRPKNPDHSRQLPVNDALGISITSSLANDCAQHIYALFLLAALTMVKNIRGKTLVESPSLRLVNGNVSSILEAFTSSGLGSTGDALSCVLPALKWHNRLPAAADAFSQVRSEAGKVVEAKEWENAEGLLLWAITQSEQKEDEKSKNEYLLFLLSLCECYRKASLSGTSADIGVNGISSLLKHHGPRWASEVTFQTSAGAQHLADVLHCYQEAILKLAREYDTGEIKETQEKQLHDGQKPPVALVPTLYMALGSRNLAAALYHLSRREQPDGTSHRTTDKSLRTELSYAAEWGWYPVVQSLVEDGSRVEEADAFDRTPLSYAAVCGDQNTFSFLLKKDQNPNSGDKKKPLCAFLRRRKQPN